MKKQTATILSAELSGFQSLIESLSPEELTPLMSDIHALIENNIRLHQGKINRYTGDTFLAAFQSKTAAKNALDAAFELKDQVNSFISDKKLEQAFDLKTGIATGGIIITDAGDEHKQPTLMGEAVKHATRISRFAGEGQLLSDDKTLDGLKDDFAFQKLEPIPLKGGEETLPIFELIAKKRKKLDLTKSSRRKITSEMVGRIREAELIEGLIKNLVSGKGNVVNIVGKAGIGKSRLLAEIQAQPLFEGIVLLQGSASSIGKNLSFHPIISIFKSWAKITEDDSQQASAEKLQKEIQRVAPDKVGEIYPFLATMMGLPLAGEHQERITGIEGEALEKLILKNLRDLIITSVKVTPLIVVIEDMHWADSSSITLLESLFKLSGSHRVMFVNILRPGYKETGDYILKYLVDNLPGDHITINISPLAIAESKELIGNLLQHVRLPDEINEVIIKKTEGNPFFIEEVIRSFIDEGIVEIKDNLFRVTDKIHTALIPETINDVILSRVDKLDEKTKELLKTASVIGRNFYYKLLEEAADTIGELDERLEYLKDVQLISESNPKEEIEYLFKHALAQQLTYDSIIQQSRKDLHLKIARSIEKVFAENIQDYYGTLAYHYTKAENQEKTIQYLILAGDESMKSGASSEASNFYKDALDQMPESRKNDISDFEIRDLKFKVAFAYHAIGKNIEARAGFEALCRKYFGYNILDSGYPLIFRGIISMFKFILMINNQSLFFKKEADDDFHVFARTIKQWGEAIATADPRNFAFNGFHILVKLSKYQLHNSIHGLAVFVESSSMYMWTGISFNVSRKMLDYAEKGGAENNPVSRATYRFVLKMHEFMTGDWKVDEDFQQVYEMGTRVGHFWPITIYVMYAGMVNIELGKFDALLDNVQKLNDISETFDNNHAKAQMYRMMAPGYYRFRRLDEAIKLADEGIEYTRKTGHFAMLMVLYCSKSQVLTLTGHLNEARLAFNEADKLIEHLKIITIYYCPYLLAKVKLEFEELKSLSKNDRNYKQKLKDTIGTSNKLISKSKKMIGSLTEAYLIRAKIDKFLNKQKNAFKNLQLAIITGEKYKGRLELSRACFETGKFLSDPSNKFKKLNGHPASHYLEKAKAMFEEMDLQWDLEEYGRFISGKVTP